MALVHFFKKRQGSSCTKHRSGPSFGSQVPIITLLRGYMEVFQPLSPDGTNNLISTELSYFWFNRKLKQNFLNTKIGLTVSAVLVNSKGVLRGGPMNDIELARDLIALAVGPRSTSTTVHYC